MIRELQQSIHPRVKARKDKVNTCSMRSKKNGGRGGKPLRRALDRLAVRVKDFNRTNSENKNPKSANAYTKPGSMKP